MNKNILGRLRQLAYLYNVQTAYYDVTHRRRQASADSLLAVLQALGAPVASLDDIAPALRERRQALRQQMLEPVIIAWNGKCPVIRVCIPAGMADAAWHGHLETEDNRRKTWHWRPAELPVLESIEVEGRRFLVKGITLPEKLSSGYHRFSLEIKGSTRETLIIAAPVKTYLSSGEAKKRKWGTFLPLYALQARNSRGSGDYSGLEALADWVSSLGGNVVATLPLLPTFLDEPFEPSPYAPVSRLMWNEFYIDINGVPEMAECPRARELLPSLAEINELHDLPLVDYRRLMKFKRRVLEELSQCLSERTSDRSADFQHFIEANPLVADYARFRAVMEKQHTPWPAWPQRLRGGTLKEGDYEDKNILYHAYAQWLAHQQVRKLADRARRRGVMLYFDLPLGTHPEGYDVWRERESFALEATAGAPPDAVFTGGQDWGFPPLHPEKIREQGYRYVINYLRHHLQHAGMLRIDHVMGLHRLFWIPRGLDASHGVYVRYHAEELYAILALESHRSRSIIVGEDLGTVPYYVRPAMSRHGLQRMYVVHYELAGNPRKPLGRIPADAVASLNTHDMPPFAAFWQGLDIEERLRLDVLSKKGASVEKRTRRTCQDALVAFLRKKNLLGEDDTDILAILHACLSFLSASAARIVLVNLEDLWLETESQNVPGTGDRNPNWRRKARYAPEDFCQLPEIRDTLNKINELRKKRVK